MQIAAPSAGSCGMRASRTGRSVLALNSEAEAPPLSDRGAMRSRSLKRLVAEELVRRMRFADEELPRLEKCFRVEGRGDVHRVALDSDVISLEGAPFDADESSSCVAEDMAIHVEANLKELRGRFGIDLPWRSSGGSPY